MHTLADIPGEAIPLAAICGSVAIALVSIIVGGMSKATRAKAREQTRREVAAYVAEGSMTPEEAERILKAAPDKGAAGCCGQKE